jgi:hypothetical protein
MSALGKRTAMQAMASIPCLASSTRFILYRISVREDWQPSTVSLVIAHTLEEMHLDNPSFRTLTLSPPNSCTIAPITRSVSIDTCAVNFE